MIYICNQPQPSGRWAIPFFQFANCIHNCLEEQNIDSRLIETVPSDLKLDINDFIIIFQINFVGYHKQCLIEGSNDFWNSIHKQVILIVSEPICGTHKHLISQLYHQAVHSIWDYSIFNINTYHKDNIVSYLVPNGYHPCLEYENPIVAPEKDIDILFYGSLNSRRQEIFSKLKEKYNVVYGNFKLDEMTELLKRTKIIPIIFSYDTDKCVDFYRLAPLLSNNCFVIHEEPSIEYVETKKLFDKILYEPYATFTERIIYYLNMTQNERDKISTEIGGWWKETHHIKNYIPFSTLQ